jgi:putative ABC transport system permease protein
MSVPGRKWRACLRIARREVWRSKARSLVVVAMIGVPVLLFAAAGILLRTNAASESETTLRGLGSADASVVAEGRTPVVQSFDGDALPADGADPGAEGSPWTAREVAAKTGGRAIPMRTGKVLLPAGKGAIAAQVRELDIRDPVFDGLATVTSGRAPAKPGEVLVSETLAERGFEPGSSLRTNDRTLRVVGVVRDPSDFSVSEIVGLTGSVLGPDDDAKLRYLVDTGGAAVSWTDVRRLNRLGLVVTSRAVLSNPPPESALAPQFRSEPSDSGTDASLAYFYALLVGSVVLQIALLAGPAFAVGARRQRRQLALLLATGGTPRDIRRVVLAQGLVLGFGASAAGIGLAIGGLVAARPLIETAFGFELGPYDLQPLDLALIAALGTFSAFAAAFVPARQAARLQPVEALTGRGAVRTRLGWPFVGGLLTAGGVIAIATGVTTPVDGEIRVVPGTFAIVAGLIMMLPAMLGMLGRLGTRLPLAFRLAARDTARHRARSAAAVAAVMGTTIGVTALAIGSSSDFAESRRDYMPRAKPGVMEISVGSSADSGITQAQLESLTAEVRRILPERSVLLTYGAGAPSNNSMRFAEMLDPACTTKDCSPFIPEWTGSGTVGSGTVLLAAEPAELEKLAGPLTAEQSQTLRSGGVLVPDGAAVSAGGRAWVRTYQVGDPESTRKITELPAAAAPQLGTRTKAGYVSMAEMVTSRQTAERLGLSVQPLQIVAAPGGPEVTAAQQEEIQELVNGLDLGGEVYVERGFQESYTPVFLILAVLGGLIVLVGTATSTALSLDDARPDSATLAAVGAAPKTRRAQAMAYAAVIGLTGAVLGALAGAAPGIAVSWPLTTSSPGGHILDIPWLLLGLTVLAVPVFTALCAALFTRSTVPMVRRAE